LKAENVVKAVSSSLETVVYEAQSFVESERKLVAEVKKRTEDAVSAELGRLRSQNALLTRLLDAEKLKLESAQGELLQRFAGLLGEFTAQRNHGLREAFAEVERSNAEAEPALTTFEEAQCMVVDQAVVRGRQWGAELDKKGVELKRTKDTALKVSVLPHPRLPVVDYMHRRWALGVTCW
jgi:kinesin family protein 11